MDDWYDSFEEDEDFFFEPIDVENTFYGDEETFEPFVTSFNDEHDFSEKFIDMDFFYILPGRYGSFIPAELSSFWSSFDFSEELSPVE